MILCITKDEERLMHKIKLIDDKNDNLLKNNLKNNKKKSKKFIKIKDSLFEIGIREGLIEKEGNEYFFIGNYETFLAFKIKNEYSYDYLD
jgi:hypothetical protein